MSSLFSDSNMKKETSCTQCPFLYNTAVMSVEKPCSLHYTNSLTSIAYTFAKHGSPKVRHCLNLRGSSYHVESCHPPLRQANAKCTIYHLC